MSIHESAENYLETILILKNRLGTVRSIDIVKELDYTKPSVSVAMKNLRESGHISMDEDGHINLTDSGLKIAGSMYERHTLLINFLVALGVDKDAAGEDACRIEHVISEQSFNAIKAHVEKLKG